MACFAGEAGKKGNGKTKGAALLDSAEHGLGAKEQKIMCSGIQLSFSSSELGSLGTPVFYDFLTDDESSNPQVLVPHNPGILPSAT